MSWGVKPVLTEEYPSLDIMFFQVFRHAIDVMNLETGDKVVLTGGQMGINGGKTNTIKVEIVQ